MGALAGAPLRELTSHALLIAPRAKRAVPQFAWRAARLPYPNEIRIEDLSESPELVAKEIEGHGNGDRDRLGGKLSK
jgi:hypothetical protein